MFQAPPLLLSADFDPFPAAIIVIALVAGFVKWLWENWQMRRQSAPPQMTEEQRQMREAAWLKQTGQNAPPLPPPPAAPSPWDELRKAWKELQETAKQAQVPARPVQHARTAKPSARPPPVPQQRQQPARAAVPSAQLPPAVVVAAAPAPVAKEAYDPPHKTTAVSMLATLQHLRRDPALMRQAILMQEILGPPKALQTSGNLANYEFLL